MDPPIMYNNVDCGWGGPGVDKRVTGALLHLYLMWYYVELNYTHARDE